MLNILKPIQKKSHVITTLENNILIITISDKTAKNALDEPHYLSLAESIEFGNTSQDVNCIVITGNSGVFTTGNSKEGLTETKDKNRLGQNTRRYLTSLVQNKKPMLALVDGAAIGIGVTTLFHCDVVISTKKSFFHTPFTDLHVTPEASSSLLGPRQLGYRNSFKLMVLGERWRASKALEYGLVDEVYDTLEGAESAIDKITSKLSKKPLNSLMASRTLIRPTVDEMNAAMCREIIEFERCISDAPDVV